MCFIEMIECNVIPKGIECFHCAKSKSAVVCWKPSLHWLGVWLRIYFEVLPQTTT